MTDADVIREVKRRHLKANIDQFERDKDAVIHWDRAWVDPGGTIPFGEGPYLKVPVTRAHGSDETVHRVYPPMAILRRIQRHWTPGSKHT